MSSKEDKLYTSNRLLSGFREIEKLHPHVMLTYLALFGSFLVLIFLLVTLSIEFGGDPALLSDVYIPKFFIIASLVLLVSNQVSKGILKFFQEEDIESIRKKIFSVFLIGGVFLIFQFIGWLELVFQGLAINKNVLGTYLFLITGYHMLHVIIALIYIAYMLYMTKNIFLDPVKNLIYFTSPYERIKLEIFVTFWKFVNISWIFLFIWILFIL